MLRHLIVGATGFIGRALLHEARKTGPALGTSSTGREGLAKLRLDAPSTAEQGIIAPGDIVYVTAAISSPDVCARNPALAVAVNVTGTTALVEAALARGARVIFLSSDTVYGERTAPFSESAPCSPAGEYAAMKHSLEAAFAHAPSFKVVRLSYVFAREDKFTRYLRSCADDGREAEIFHPFSRAIVHRNDVIAGLIGLAERWDEYPQRVLNFGGPELLSRVAIAELIKETAMPALRLRVVEPEAEFFRNRPRAINMLSPLLPKLCRRATTSLRDAAAAEFQPSLRNNP